MNAPTNFLKSTPPHFGPMSAGLRMTTEEFLGAADFDESFRYELIDGVLVVTPPPADSEANPNGELEHLLRLYQYTHPQGFHLDGTMFERDVQTRFGVRRVDRAIWCGLGRRPNSRQDIPTIIVEFVSPGKKAFLRDYEEKRAEYLEIGAKEYWVIDRFQRQMTVFFSPPTEPSSRIVTELEKYSTPLLPGFELPLGRLLALANDA